MPASHGGLGVSRPGGSKAQYRRERPRQTRIRTVGRPRELCSKRQRTQAVLDGWPVTGHLDATVDSKKWEY